MASAEAMFDDPDLGRRDARTVRARDGFRRALRALTGEALPAGDAGDAARLKASACHLVDALLAAQGRGRDAGAGRTEALRRRTLVDAEADRLLLDILALDEASDPHRVRALERAYRARLLRLRSVLARALPAEAPGPLRSTRVAASVLAALLAAAASLAAVYQWQDPHYILERRGQVFWTPSAGEAFTEQRSREFTVRVDGRFRSYALRFDRPVMMAGLRLDPVDDAAVTEVAIRRIRLVGPDGAVPRAFTPGGERWRCVNCVWMRPGPGAARLRPASADPFIIGPAAAPVDVSGVRIEMRARAKQSPWQWITRVEPLQR